MKRRFPSLPRWRATRRFSLRQAKRALDGGQGLSLEEGLDLENRMYEACLDTRDCREALRAFAERRRPIFTGE